MDRLKRRSPVASDRGAPRSSRGAENEVGRIEERAWRGDRPPADLTGVLVHRVLGAPGDVMAVGPEARQQRAGTLGLPGAGERNGGILEPDGKTARVAPGGRRGDGI